MLYFETPDAFVPWTGQPVKGLRHPKNIEELWKDEELAAIKLYRPVEADPVPAGKLVTATVVQRVNGVVKYVDTLVNGPAQVELDTLEIEEKLTQGRKPEKTLTNYIRLQLNEIRAALVPPLPPITKAKMKADLLDQLTK